MSRSVRWLLLLLVIAACREPRSESGRDGGVEFEAPRLIPAIRAQIIEIEDVERATEGTPAAFRNGVGTLVNAMRADLNRVGLTNAEDFYSLSDSVLRKIRGGGDAVGQVERLIENYEGKMRKAAN